MSQGSPHPQQSPRARWDTQAACWCGLGLGSEEHADPFAGRLCPGEPEARGPSGSGEVQDWGGTPQGTWGCEDGQLNLRDVIRSWGPDSDFLPEHRPPVPGAENAKRLAGLVQTGNRAGSQPEKYGRSPHCPGRRSPVMHRNLPNCFLDTFTRAKCFFKKNKGNPKWGTIAGKGGETQETNFLD